MRRYSQSPPATRATSPFNRRTPFAIRSWHKGGAHPAIYRRRSTSKQLPYLTARGGVAKAVILDGNGRPIFEDSNGNLIGSIDVVPGQNNVLHLQGGENVLGPAAPNNPLGQLRLDANGHPDAVIGPQNNVIRGHLRKDTVNDLWRRLPGASPQQQIETIVVWLSQVGTRLSAEAGRQIRPIIYSGNTWRELLASPTDNNGGPWQVVRNGVTFQVDNFANFPFWFAQYPTNPAGVTQLRLFPTTWATVGQRFIWQYAADPDRNVLVRITAVTPDPHSNAIATITIEEETDLTFLEALAGIQRPTAPRALTRISPAPIDASPRRSFNVLLLGQGFNSGEFPAIAQRAWSDPNNLHSITDTAPFGSLRNPSRIAVYADDGTGVFLRMRQTPSNVAGLDDALAIPPDAATLLRDYLPLLKIVGADGIETTADKVWLQQRRQVGSTGTLIVILRNGRLPARAAAPPVPQPPQRPAELYQIDPSENFPVPVIGVNVTWGDELWPLPIVRALAQNLGGLRDEFELPGDAYDHPAPELEQTPAPNLIFIDQATRNQLVAGGAVPPDIAKQALATWRLPASTALDFFASGAALGAPGSIHLVEGGDGYRQQVLRSDFDCLMRRMPVTTATSIPNVAGQPIRAANVPFCRVCREWLEAAQRGAAQVYVGDRIRLDNQRIAYDWVNWNTRESPAVGFDPGRAFNRVHTMTVPADEPKWSIAVSYNPAAATLADLFQITAVRLSQRPGDPYASATDIVRSIRFSDLSVSFSHRERPGGPLLDPQGHADPQGGSPRPSALPVRSTTSSITPQLELASDGGTDIAPIKLGVKLTLAFPFAGNWPDIPAPHAPHSIKLFTVEAVLGIVLSGEQYVDPLFPVRGCKDLAAACVAGSPVIGPDHNRPTSGRGRCRRRQ